MSKEIENITAAFRKARKEGSALLEAGRLSWEDFQFCMIGFEIDLKNAGVEL